MAEQEQAKQAGTSYGLRVTLPTNEEIWLNFTQVKPGGAITGSVQHFDFDPNSREWGDEDGPATMCGRTEMFVLHKIAGSTKERELISREEYEQSFTGVLRAAGAAGCG